MKRLAASILVSVLAMAIFVAPAQGAESDYGLQAVEGSLSVPRAGDHGDFTTYLTLKGDPSTPLDANGFRFPFAATRDLTFELPPGLIGNPAVVDHCTVADLFTWQEPGDFVGCPNSSQVGVAKNAVFLSEKDSGQFFSPIFMMERPGGDVVARLGLVAYNIPTLVDIRLRPETDYGLKAEVHGIPRLVSIAAVETTLWGVPADHIHDTERMTAREGLLNGATSSPPRPPGGPPLALMSNPTSCGFKEITVSAFAWALSPVSDSRSAGLPPIVACNRLDFNPNISFQLSPDASVQSPVHSADSPIGLDVTLSVPQDTITQPNTPTEANLKKAEVVLPRGMSLNPAAADGLEGCSEAQIGLISENPLRFDDSVASCPDGSKVGSAVITTPLLPEPLSGSLYLAEPNDNPFDTLLSGYLVVKGQGAILKLAGRFDIDPQTGQITATFDNNPQQPFSLARLHFKGGPRGVLITPPRCGAYEIVSRLSPWSAGDPDNPAADEIVTRTSTFTIDEGPAGAPCPNGALEPRLEAGTTNPTAGAHSPFVLRLRRDDGTGIFTSIGVSIPEGLTAKLAAVPYCPDAVLAAFPNPPLRNAGLAELSAPACPAASQIGTVSAGAGAGSPFYLNTGRAYLAGPYKGAPLSLAVLTPAVAGPFDLGTVLVRSAVHVDPVTAKISIQSDPIPTVLEGIPLDLRDIAVIVDRPGFMLNPTDCEPMAVTATVHGQSGNVASASSRFQVDKCGALGFKPKLSLRLKGGTRRGDHPALSAVLRARPGDAAISSAQVTLPHSAFLDQAHIRTICTRVQFAARACPAGSVYGFARAITPLLEKPLEGPVYLRSSSHNLPDLVADLNGQIEVELRGRIDSIKGGIRSSFEAVPDAPVSKFFLSMQGGKKGLIVNSTSLCAKTNRAKARFVAHNGRALTLRPAMKTSCPQVSRKKPHKRRW